MAELRLYLDVSCLNRPFDDQSQQRIRRESEAVCHILEAIDAARWIQVTSQMALIEIEAITDPARRRRIRQLLPASTMELTAPVFARAGELTKLGFKAADAVHVAAAEALAADVFLTCDDRLLNRCSKLISEVKFRAANPLIWLEEQNRATNIG